MIMTWIAVIVFFILLICGLIILNCIQKDCKKLNELRTIKNNLTTEIETIEQELANKKINFATTLQKYEYDINAQLNTLKQQEEEKRISLKEETEEYKKEVQKEIENCKYSLEKMKATRDAALAARIREKEEKEKLSFYCLHIDNSELDDIQKLEEVKKFLHEPRILAMLIWQTYFSKPLKALSANVLGTIPVTGIYKITNLKTKECYIGQAVDVAKRFSEHAKCGLGIDTPAANKLYKAMQEYGLQNFSWELLEKCSREQLNEKERYYIDFYNSVNYGYNILKGNK